MVPNFSSHMLPLHGLDNKHTVFGQVTDGMKVLLSIPPRDPSKRDSPCGKADICDHP